MKRFIEQEIIELGNCRDRFYFIIIGCQNVELYAITSNYFDLT